MLPLFRDGLLDALALVLPVECAGCGAPDRPVCDRCRLSLEPDPTERRLADGTPVFAGLDYDGIVRQVILAFKEQGRVELARSLAPALAEAVRVAGVAVAARGSAAIDPTPIEVVAVPGSRRARRRRGFDPLGSLVARAGLDRARVFAAARPHATQKSLTLEQRSANLVDVFGVRVPVSGRRFLLVDDVVTTGATLLAAAATLRSAGAEVVAAAAVASTPRRAGTSGRLHRERSVTFP